MDHNLEDSLNLESDMGSMDFDHSGVVVNQADITLETSHEEDIPMQFEQIEEQPMLMDTGNEEIIVSDFMNDQYTLQEYSVQDDQITEDTSGAVESDQLSVLTSQSDSMIDLKFEPQASVSQDVTIQPQYISVKAAVGPTRAPMKSDMLVASMPRQVPIAPKPVPAPRAPKVLNTRPFSIKQPKPATNNPAPSKQFAIAPKPVPKPVALVANKTPTGLNKLLSGVLPGNMKRGTVLTQIGKQLVMMPAGAQKIKLVSSNSGTFQYVRANSDQAQLIATKSGSGVNPQKLLQAKVIVQGTSQNMDSNQPAVITKLLPAGSSAAPQTRYVMQQKTVPISIGGNKVILTSPTKSGMKFGKKQIIAIKSPTPKLIPATSHGTSKKVVITTNPNQNVILKTTAPPKTTQLNNDGNVVVQGQRSQLHQINVPGKGIQYIRLITNSSPAPQKVVPKAQPPVLAVPSKSFVLTDNKGNLIQMTAEKVSSGQPPPLIITGSIGATSRMTTKPQRKLVRIAPVTAKTAQPTTQQPTRSAQSLLAPLSPTADCKLEETVETDLLAGRTMSRDSQDLVDDAEASAEDLEPEEEIHSKAELRALLDEAVTEDTADAMHTMHEVEVDFEKRETSENEEEDNSMDHDSSHKSEEHPLIVIPTNFVKQESQIRVTSEHSRRKDDSLNYTNIETEVTAPYLSPKPSHAVSESDIVAGELGMRPRKACNCTKSQCLKLYCDCFANGEFCNRCNCNNCHNNLENEELRQKAIRACLDRNPNAFRPKIGKAKSGGPDIVRRHNKGCNCKRSGCLKNYCECFEAKIACTVMCKCVGCRNVEDTFERRRAVRRAGAASRPPPPALHLRQPCSFMTSEVIEAVCQCLVAAAVESGEGREGEAEPGERGGEGETEAADPVRDVIEEFARCLQDIISASHQSTAVSVLDEVTAP